MLEQNWKRNYCIMDILPYLSAEQLKWFQHGALNFKRNHVANRIANEMQHAIFVLQSGVPAIMAQDWRAIFSAELWRDSPGWQEDILNYNFVEELADWSLFQLQAHENRDIDHLTSKIPALRMAADLDCRPGVQNLPHVLVSRIEECLNHKRILEDFPTEFIKAINQLFGSLQHPPQYRVKAVELLAYFCFFASKIRLFFAWQRQLLVEAVKGVLFETSNDLSLG